ncbi:stage III sporulation protein AF [Clostridium paraputrificum]|uniref:stage III sporulation protein AF n=1 Tax=Clostridium TaxID=1485 RepID=UPI003D32ACA2
MELIKNFVITLVTTLIFITAVELVGPDNSMKKYLKFVLGLILVAVLLTPIINFFNNGEGVLIETIDKFEKEITNDAKEADKSDREEKVKEKTFKEKFNKDCINLLTNKFKNMDFVSNINCKVDFENPEFEVIALKVGVKKRDIKEIQKIEIGEEQVEEEDETQKDIKNFLSEELGIDKEKISIYYM